MYYVQFTEARNGEMVDCLGSDAVFILDGRNTLKKMTCDAMTRMDQLRHVKKIDGFRIMKGELKAGGTSVLLREWVRSGCM